MESSGLVGVPYPLLPHPRHHSYWHGWIWQRERRHEGHGRRRHGLTGTALPLPILIHSSNREAGEAVDTGRAHQNLETYITNSLEEPENIP